VKGVGVGIGEGETETGSGECVEGVGRHGVTANLLGEGKRAQGRDTAPQHHPHVARPCW